MEFAEGQPRTQRAEKGGRGLTNQQASSDRDKTPFAFVRRFPLSIAGVSSGVSHRTHLEAVSIIHFSNSILVPQEYSTT